jgi:hypothetical protein
MKVITFIGIFMCASLQNVVAKRTVSLLINLISFTQNIQFLTGWPDIWKNIVQEQQLWHQNYRCEKDSDKKKQSNPPIDKYRRFKFSWFRQGRRGNSKF